MKYLKKINEFFDNEIEREDDFNLGYDEQEGDENLYDEEDFYSTDEEEGEDFDNEEDFYSNEREDENSLEDDEEGFEDEESRNWGDEEAKLERISSFNSFNEKMNAGFKAYLDKKKAEKAGKKGSKEEKEEDTKKGGKKAKPDFLDIDKDGDKKESMKKAAADKKAKKK